MSHYARVYIQSLTVVLVAFFGVAASAYEQISWRYDQNLRTESLLRRIACTESQVAACKLSVRECFERCAKSPDLGSKSDCMLRCSYDSIACFKACDR
jgi:hypothetical protein